MARFEKDKLTEAITAVVREKIKSGDIVAVNVARGEDSEGESIILVDVIFDTKAKLDAKETAALTRYVRRRLIEMDETRFPFFSYMSKKEAGNLAAA